MQVNSALNSYNYYQSPQKSFTENNRYEGFSGAVTKCEDGENGGRFLGLTMIPEEGKSVTYGMRAMLSDKSTPANPIVQVVSNLDGKKEVFDVDISKVDPENASQIEMFALCCYEDKCGRGTGSTFGSYHTFKMMKETAEQNGSRKQVDANISAWDQFRYEKANWVKTCEFALDILQAIKDPRVMDMFSKGTKLLSMYSRYAGMKE